MSTYLEYIVYFLIVVISSILGGAWGFIISVGILTFIIRYREPIEIPYVRPLTVKEKWLLTDLSRVPTDCHEDYRTFLASVEWAILRQEALKRDRHRCQHCGYIGDRLQVHHTSYDGIYTMTFHVEQLLVLCDICHNDLHQKMRR